MRIVVAAGGSRGDIQPMIALALRLRERGHDIVFCAPPNFGDWIAGHGFTVHGLGRDIQAFLAEVGLDVNRALVALRNDIRSEFVVFARVAAGADLIVGASVTCAGVSHAEKLGIPYAYVLYSPSLLPSAFHPAPTCPFLRLPRWVNRLTWWMTRRVWNGLFRSILNDERRKLALEPTPDVWSHIQNASLILASEPALAQPAGDAPGLVDQTGAFFLPEPDELPADLERFLEEGPPPVYIGFGSMPDRHPERSTAMLLEAIRRSGVRAIISRGWAGLGKGSAIPPGVHLAGPLPHGKLFPRLAAVVHHGGAGTLSNAARAGVPQLLVPHLLDQFFWADRTTSLQIGPPPIRRGRLDVARLSTALQEVAGNSRYRESARALAGNVIRDGVDRAARAVESLAARRQPRDGGIAAAAG